MTDRNGGWVRSGLQAAATEAMTKKKLTLNALSKAVHIDVASLERIMKGQKHGTMLQWSAILTELGLEMRVGEFGQKTEEKPHECLVCNCLVTTAWYFLCPIHGLKARPEFWDQTSLRGVRYAHPPHRDDGTRVDRLEITCGSRAGGCHCLNPQYYSGSHRCVHGSWPSRGRHEAHDVVQSEFQLQLDKMASEFQVQLDRLATQFDRRIAKLEEATRAQKDHVHQSYSGGPRSSI